MGRISYFFRCLCGTISWRQLVVGEKGRRVAHCAAFPLEDRLPALSDSVKRIGVRGRLQVIDIERQGVELFVAVTTLSHRVRQFLEPREVRRNKAMVVGEGVATVKSSSVHCRITH